MASKKPRSPKPKSSGTGVDKALEEASEDSQELKGRTVVDRGAEGAEKACIRALHLDPPMDSRYTLNSKPHMIPPNLQNP